MKRLFWAFLILLLMAALAPLAFYLALPRILRPMVEAKLSDFGCQDPRLVVNRIGRDEAEFSEIYCLLPGRGEFRGQNVRVSYALKELYGGSLGAIVVERAELNLLRADAEEQSPGLAIPGSFFALLPISEIKMMRIDAMFPLGGGEPVRVAAGLELRFHALSMEGELQAKSEVPRLDAKVGFELSASRASFVFERGKFVFPSGQVELSKNSKLEMKLGGNQLSAALPGEVSVRLMQGKKSHELRLKNLKAEIEEKRVRADFLLAYGGDLIEAPLSLDWSLESEALGFELKSARASPAKVWPLAQDFLDKKKLSVQFSSGEVRASAKGRARLGENPALLSAAVSFDLKGIGGTYGEHRFSGIQGPLRLQMSEVGFALQPTELKIATYDPGFPMKNIKARLEAKGAGKGVDMRLTEVEAEIFSGKARVAELAVNSQALRSDFQLELDGLDLGEIIALQKQDNISASGTVDGLIPVGLTEAGVVVNAGTVKARPPGGRIAYEAGAGLRAAATGNQGLRLAVDVLRNFQYQLLEGKVDYRASGDLEIALRLEGQNQEWSGGRPVHFNLTVSENLPVLLKSLRIADEAGEAIRRRMGHE
jgi:hypothetical protein